MSKEKEINYLKNLGKEGIKHSINKPFSDERCGNILAEIGAIISILPEPPLKILDLGCGTGWTSRFLAKTGYEVIGLDISKDAIKYAKKNKQKEKIKNLQFIVGDYENISFDNEFDCVIFFDALHHANNERKSIAQAYKALRKGGICIISEPGIGHKKTHNSINMIKKYGITEKDMPPNLTIKLGKRAKFRKFKIYPRANHINAALYNKQNKIPKYKGLFKFKFLRTLASIFLITIYKRYDGIVVMKK